MALSLGSAMLAADTNLTQERESFDPFVEMQKMHQEMDRLFNNFHQKMGIDSYFDKFDTLGGSFGSRPAIDFEDKGDKYELKANIPGADDQKISVTTKDGILKIEAITQKSKEKKEGDKFLKQERFVGSYTRIFSLPEDADGENIKTDYKDGVLTVTIAKKKK
jgi:HSP20 family protein